MSISNGQLANATNFNAAFVSKSSYVPLFFGAIVGSTTGCTHATIAAVVADVSVASGSRVLITESLTINATIAITKALFLDFQPGISYTKGSAGTCITLGVAGCRVRGARFVNFTTAAIEILSTFNYNFVTECRFSSCTLEVLESDATPNNMIFANITE